VDRVHVYKNLEGNGREQESEQTNRSTHSPPSLRKLDENRQTSHLCILNSIQLSFIFFSPLVQRVDSLSDDFLVLYQSCTPTSIQEVRPSSEYVTSLSFLDYAVSTMSNRSETATVPPLLQTALIVDGEPRAIMVARGLLHRGSLIFDSGCLLVRRSVPPVCPFS
jgi:hypothetical protein